MSAQRCCNINQISIVNERFDNLISSRLNTSKTGQIVIIAHRLNESDLPAYVRKQGGWRHVVLPLIAERKKTYDLGYGKWTKQLKHLRKNAINPSFQLFYQQGGGGHAPMTIKAEHFAVYDLRPMPSQAGWKTVKQRECE